MKARKIIRRGEAIYYKHDNYLFKINGNICSFIGIKSYKHFYPNWGHSTWGLEIIQGSGAEKLTIEQAHKEFPDCFN